MEVRVSGGALGHHVEGTVSPRLGVGKVIPFLRMVSRSAYVHHKIRVGKRWWEGRTDWLVRILSVRLQYYHFHLGDRELIDVWGQRRGPHQSPALREHPPLVGRKVGGRGGLGRLHWVLVVHNRGVDMVDSRQGQSEGRWGRPAVLMAACEPEGSIIEQPGFSCGGPATGLWSQTSQFCIPVLPLTGWASDQLSNFLNPPCASSPICKMGIIIVPTSRGWYTDTVN